MYDKTVPPWVDRCIAAALALMSGAILALAILGLWTAIRFLAGVR